MVTADLVSQFDLFKDLSEVQLAAVANLGQEVLCEQGSCSFAKERRDE